jgi:hypothetical protein
MTVLSSRGEFNLKEKEWRFGPFGRTMPFVPFVCFVVASLSMRAYTRFISGNFQNAQSE